MLDVIAGAMGAFLIIMVILWPYYKNDEIIQELRQKLLTSEAEQTRLQGENTHLQDQLEGCRSENERIAETQAHVAQLLEQCRETTQTLAEEKTQVTEQANQYEQRIIQLEQEKSELQEEVRKLGFTLREKDVVFVVDISGSMRHDNRIHNVTTGIKMQIATMDETYTTDVVFFPNRANQSCFSAIHPDYGCMWDGLTQVTTEKKYAAYRFLSALQPAGSTPTESVLNFVLDSYPDAGAIILFSDGVPTVGDQDLPWTELEGILERVTARNNGQKKISAIGVGPEFRDEHSTMDQVRFLQILAERNGGFYSGF